MIFILGIITGLIIAELILVVILLFKSDIQEKIKIVEKNIGDAFNRPRGEVFLPKTEAEEERDKIVEKNKAMGKDTPIEELK